MGDLRWATLHTEMMKNRKVDLSPAMACWNEGRLEDAEHQLRQVLDGTPDLPLALQLLGAVYCRQARYADALPPLQRACELQPDNAASLHELSQVLARLGRREQALESVDASLALEPDNPAALMLRARTLMELQWPLCALHSIERALALAPDWAFAWQCRGDVLALLVEAGMKRRAAAIDSYRRAMALGGDADELAFSLAVLGEGAPPAVVPATVVRELFDAYAPNFEQHLTQALNYRGHEYIGQMLHRADLPLPLAEVWDLGCGTGLCAPLLRPLARHLVGVDLSPRMLQIAQARGTYDHLRCGDIVACLQGRHSDIDLLVAADVFVYIGSLEAVFEASKHALRPGAHLAFSIESNEDAEYTLSSTRRYAHSIGYIERLASSHGLHLVERVLRVLRENLGQEVPGWVVLLQRGFS